MSKTSLRIWTRHWLLFEDADLQSRHSKRIVILSDDNRQLWIAQFQNEKASAFAEALCCAALNLSALAIVVLVLVDLF